eukprot:77807-Chlamydomonas_euryale.AAC.2
MGARVGAWAHGHVGASAGAWAHQRMHPLTHGHTRACTHEHMGTPAQALMNTWAHSRMHP